MSTLWQSAFGNRVILESLTSSATGGSLRPKVTSRGAPTKDQTLTQSTCTSRSGATHTQIKPKIGASNGPRTA